MQWVGTPVQYKLHTEYLATGREFDDSDADVALLLLRQCMAKAYEEDSRMLRNNTKSRNPTKSKVPPADIRSETTVTETSPRGDEDITTFTAHKL
jgi:hypothetical protein